MKTSKIECKCYRKTQIVFFFSLLFAYNFLPAQLRRDFAADTNLYTYKARAEVYFDSLRLVLPDSIMNMEGGEFSEYQKFLHFWEPRLFPHGSFYKYYKALL